MDKIWLNSYPAGVPADIAIDHCPSLVALVDEACRRYSGQTAFISMGRELSYADLDARSREFAGWLQSRGLGKGDRVALMMPNLLQYPVALFGALRAGCVVVNCNPLYTPRELEHQLKDSGATAIVIVENFAHTLEQVVGHTAIRHVVVTSMGEMLGFPKGMLVNWVVRHAKKLVPPWSLAGSIDFAAALAEGRRKPPKPVVLGHDDLAFLQYTGGTTGVPKGAMLSHGHIAANVMQAHAWIRPVIRDGQEFIVTALPLYHIFALTACFMLGARLGMANLLIPNPRDIPGFVKTLARHRVNMFPAVNTLFNALANDPDFARLDFSDLVISNGGGMAVQQATAEKWRKITGCPVVEGYGLSETSPVVTVNRFDDAEFSGSIGLPVPSTSVAIRNDEGEDVPLGQPGEICIKGPQVMAGYWNRPDETAKVMTADGYFRSGDIGVMASNGSIKIVDRKKDMILVSGFNVYPNEIEQVVNLHPGVLECAAVGVPDEKSGEAVKLYVVRRDPSLSESDLADYCKDNFTAYKRPRHVEFRDELPKSNVGKILRRELRA